MTPGLSDGAVRVRDRSALDETGENLDELRGRLRKVKDRLDNTLTRLGAHRLNPTAEKRADPPAPSGHIHTLKASVAEAHDEATHLEEIASMLEGVV